MARLVGGTAFITGAGSGFGAGIAKAFSREGASVVVADLDAAYCDGESCIRGAAACSSYRVKTLCRSVDGLAEVLVDGDHAGDNSFIRAIVCGFTFMGMACRRRGCLPHEADASLWASEGTE